MTNRRKLKTKEWIYDPCVNVFKHFIQEALISLILIEVDLIWSQNLLRNFLLEHSAHELQVACCELEIVLGIVCLAVMNDKLVQLNRLTSSQMPWLWRFIDQYQVENRLLELWHFENTSDSIHGVLCDFAHRIWLLWAQTYKDKQGLHHKYQEWVLGKCASCGTCLPHSPAPLAYAIIMHTWFK